MVILNKSTLPVFKVKLSWHVTHYRPGPDAVPNARRKLKAAIAESGHVWDVIKAGGEETAVDIRLQPMVINVRFKPRLTLQDVRGKNWEITALGERRGKPRKVRSFQAVASWAKSFLFGCLMVGSFAWEMASNGWRRLKPPGS